LLIPGKLKKRSDTGWDDTQCLYIGTVSATCLSGGKWFDGQHMAFTWLPYEERSLR
jgi:hypothetical protein